MRKQDGFSAQDSHYLLKILLHILHKPNIIKRPPFMNQYSFLFVTLLAPCIFTLSSGHLQAHAALPVLNNTAKKAPSVKVLPKLSSTARVQSTNASKASSHSLVILGEKGNISSVKLRVAKASYTQPTQRMTRKEKKRVAAINRHITSKSVIILDAQTGEPIFAKAPDNPRQPASTIKVLTGMIAIKRLKNNEKVEVSHHAEKM
ncbi:MAG: hypothetical protein D3916_11740, partial [Candidatus Electrothrix sp. MAN1_4]|nr:hypothetical protein [Candidatus Electrothrix sp. MAN1_4]